MLILTISKLTRIISVHRVLVFGIISVHHVLVFSCAQHRTAHPRRVSTEWTLELVLTRVTSLSVVVGSSDVTNGAVPRSFKFNSNITSCPKLTATGRFPPTPMGFMGGTLERDAIGSNGEREREDGNGRGQDSIHDPTWFLRPSDTYDCRTEDLNLSGCLASLEISTSQWTASIIICSTVIAEHGTDYKITPVCLSVCLSSPTVLTQFRWYFAPWSRTQKVRIHLHSRMLPVSIVT